MNNSDSLSTISETPEGMVFVRSSEFLMGTPEEVLDRIAREQHFPRAWFEDEAPRHLVKVSSYFIDRHLVTNSQYLEFVSQTGYRTLAERRGFSLVYTERYWREEPGAFWRCPGGADTNLLGRWEHPVVHIAWEDAKAYAEWANKRLPTEAEWELASRGVAFRLWPWGNAWRPDLANSAEYWSDSFIADLESWKEWWRQHYATHRGLPGTTPVGFFGRSSESPFGLSDMAGNVQEWTSSLYAMYDPERIYDDVFQFVSGRYRVMRGGGWMNFRYQVRCCERIATDPSYTTFSIGFRCAKDID